MAGGDFTPTNQGLLDLFNEDFDADSHYAILLLASATPDVAAWVDLDDVSADECGDADYNRQDLTGESVTESGGTVTIDADNITFGASVTITAKYIVILRGTVGGAAGTDRIVGYADLNDGGGSVTSTSSAFNVNVNASGLATATVV